MTIGTVLGCALSCLTLMAGPAASQEQAGAGYFVMDQRLTDFFRTLERDGDIRILSSPGVSGRLRRTKLEGTEREILGRLASEFNLDLFEQGGTVHVSRRDEASLRLVRLGGVAVGRAMRAVGAAGIIFDEDAMRPTTDGNGLIVSGPPRQLALTEAVIEGLVPERPPSAAPGPKRAIRVRRGTDIQLEAVGDGGLVQMPAARTADAEEAGDG